LRAHDECVANVETEGAVLDKVIKGLTGLNDEQLAEAYRQRQLAQRPLLLPHAGGEELLSDGELGTRAPVWRASSCRQVVVGTTLNRLIVVTLDKKQLRRNELVATGADVYTAADIRRWSVRSEGSSGSWPLDGGYTSLTHFRVRTPTSRFLLSPVTREVFEFLQRSRPLTAFAKWTAWFDERQLPESSPSSAAPLPASSSPIPAGYDAQSAVKVGKRRGWIAFGVVTAVVLGGNALVFLALR
jgi:hypothetical protein